MIQDISSQISLHTLQQIEIQNICTKHVLEEMLLLINNNSSVIFLLLIYELDQRFKCHSKIIKEKYIISYFNLNPRPTELTHVNFVNMLMIRVNLLFIY